MLVVYRITSIPSSNASPLFQEDKNALNEVCLTSFLEAFKGVELKIVFLADFCNCQDMIVDVCNKYAVKFEIESSEIGQNATMLRAYELASDVDDYVLFQESDYLYRPGTGKTFFESLKRLPIVSPYDHPNYYLDHELHSEQCTIKLVGEQHYRSAERNTMTWGTHSSIVKENRDILDYEGYLDGPVWYKLKDRGHTLFVPIPSFATHMVTDWLAKGTDWQKLWRTLLPTQI